jgi:hypothetical protein
MMVQGRGRTGFPLWTHWDGVGPKAGCQFLALLHTNPTIPIVCLLKGAVTASKIKTSWSLDELS